MAVAIEPIRPHNLTTNPYEVIPATIYEIVDESPLIRTLRLRPEQPIKFHTGQCIELTIPGIGEGPFILTFHLRCHGRDHHENRLCHRVRASGTRR